ncbi:MAG: Maf family protein, partial [Phycisphaerales bacterium]|nr:Maf family protein [Phycisphaerales bacterium]
DAGVPHRAFSPGIDDGPLRPGCVKPEQWVAALAYLKARAGMERLETSERATALVLGADTVVVKGDTLVGQPRDAEDARAIIRRLRRGRHRVVTGVALLRDGARTLFHDTATVEVGDIPDERIEAYLTSGTWKGKAGAYNLAERTADGWPLQCTGDPTTVMGLPMRRLLPELAALGVVAEALP